ncbi:hypothetical protein FG87_19495 [Nocardia vulneris]|uniref:Molecular chaperone n=1 Tax=Nocardia vulneris TaxID=1141657 RepID=A0ABR4ZDJ6_9NOCA|nr:hypothetical protein FG87_19495 [Nocardia vulneris]
MRDLIASGHLAVDMTVTYRAIYSDKQVELLRQAPVLSVAQVAHLVSEPVAAAEWLARERDTSGLEFVLVYDLGATSLDVALVRVGPRQPAHCRIRQRSYDFGGRPLKLGIAECVGPATVGGLPRSPTVTSYEPALARSSFRVVERSSPRARGAQMPDWAAHLGPRTIPACAGSTLVELQVLSPNCRFSIGLFRRLDPGEPQRGRWLSWQVAWSESVAAKYAEA